MRSLIAALALVALHVVLVMRAARGYGVTFDEVAHLGAGVAYVVHDDYRLNPENGALPQLAAGAAAVWSGTKFPDTSHPAWSHSDEWTMGYQLLYEIGNDLARTLEYGRGAIAACSGATVLMTHLIARSVYGPTWISLIPPLLAAVSPTLVAHGGLITSDAFMGFFYTLAPCALWTMLNASPTLVGSIIPALYGGLTTGGLCVAKHSGVIIAFIVIALLPVRFVSGSRPSKGTTWLRVCFVLLLRLVVAVALTFLVVWASYGFRYTAFAQGECVQWKSAGLKSVLPPPGLLHSVVMIFHEYKLLPESFLYGFCYAVKSAVARNAFLWGDHGTHGWIEFFPLAVLFKTPVGTLVLMGLSLFAVVLHGLYNELSPARSAGQRSSSDRRTGYGLAPVVISFIVYWVVALCTNLNIGHRHMLPTYPPMFIFAPLPFLYPVLRPDAARGFFLIAKLVQILAAGAIVAAVIESMWYIDVPLAFFNVAVGGPKSGYRYLVDSSLDWGQDLPRLQQWVETKRASESADIYFSYFGFGNPDYYHLQDKVHYIHGSVSGMGRPKHIKSTRWRLGPGYYVIGASMLQGVYNNHASGSWNAYYESQYRRAHRMVTRLLQQPDGESILNGNHGKMWKLSEWYDGIRLGRMTSHLLEREPDEYIGYSMLVYKLNQSDLDYVLRGPAPAEVGKGRFEYLRLPLDYNTVPMPEEAIDEEEPNTSQGDSAMHEDL